MPDHLAQMLSISSHAGLFDDLVRIEKIPPTLAATVLIELLTHFRRLSGNPDRFTDDDLRTMFGLYQQGEIAREGFRLLFEAAAREGIDDWQRLTGKIGIRKVNGAKAVEVMNTLNQSFLTWLVIALTIACPVAYYIIEKWLENFPYKVPISWWVFLIAGAGALLIALITVSWQSWRASSRNPVEAHRYE